jgi:hypothetical protein
MMQATTIHLQGELKGLAVMGRGAWDDESRGDRMVIDVMV